MQRSKLTPEQYHASLKCQRYLSDWPGEKFYRLEPGLLFPVMMYFLVGSTNEANRLSQREEKSVFPGEKLLLQFLHSRLPWQSEQKLALLSGDLKTKW